MVTLQVVPGQIISNDMTCGTTAESLTYLFHIPVIWILQRRWTNSSSSVNPYTATDDYSRFLAFLFNFKRENLKEKWTLNILDWQMLRLQSRKYDEFSPTWSCGSNLAIYGLILHVAQIVNLCIKKTRIAFPPSYRPQCGVLVVEL